MPKVSVVIPVYGVEKYIERCARSLFEQTLDDIEYIFVDDCTPDRSMEILGQIIEEYRLRFAEKNYLVRTEKMLTNSGQASVRRHGIKLCTGDYIIHCDSDDWVDTDMYRAMYEKAIHEGADVVVCDYVVSDGNQDLRYVKACHTDDVDVFIHNNLFQRDPWSLCNKLFKRTACYKDDFVYPIGAMGEDMLFTIQLLLNCNRLAYINKGYYFYFTNINSISKKQTIEAVLYRFEQSKSNTDSLITIFAKKGIEKKYRFGVNYVQFTVRRLIQPIVKEDKTYLKMWRETYPGMGIYLMMNRNVKVIDKIKHILTHLHVYPFIRFENEK